MRKRLHRSRLWVPANDWTKIEDSAKSECDAVMLDLEDTVPYSHKELARTNAVKAIEDINWGGKDVGIRINSLSTNYWLDDILAVIPAKPDFLFIPKSRDAFDIRTVEAVLGFLEKKHGIEEETRLHPSIESVSALRVMYDISSSSKRNISIGMGVADLTTDVGSETTHEALLFPKYSIVLAAVFAGIHPIDTVYSNLDDSAGLEKDALFSRSLGYVGKNAKVASQVDTINHVFTPTQAEISWAQKVVEEYNEQDTKGGDIADMVSQIKKARRILSVAKDI